jgi:glycosyltransferase involved in cell wall biosynthesis
MNLTISEEKPILSIVMPVHHGEHFIGNALASVADQISPAERLSVEILIIEDATNSSSLEIVRAFSERLQLHLLVRPDLQMWQAKTNFGVSQATSDHVCWLHQDDLWLQGRFEAVKSWVAAAPEAALHIAPSLFVDAEGASLGRWGCPFDAEGAIPRDLLFRRLLVQNFIAAPAPLFRKDAWLRCGGLDESLWYTADWDVWFKLAAQGETRFHREALTAFRVHGSSLTVSGSRNIDDFSEQMKIVLQRHMPVLDERARKEVAPLAETSILVNVAMARAGVGDLSRLPNSLGAMMSLGPRGLSAFLRDSRLVERAGARLRAKMRGSM